MTRSAPTDLAVHRLVRERWSPRAFSGEPVPDEVVRRLIEAARWAPSAFNAQPWRFLVANKAADPDGHARLAAVLNDWNRAWASKAPVLIVAAAVTTSTTGEPNPHAVYDLGGAVAWLTAQATAEGLGVHQMGGFSAERARDLGLPDDVAPVAMLALGHVGSPDLLPEPLASREVGPRQRLSAEQIAFGAGWDTPRR